MTDTDRKEVENLAKLMRVFSGWDWGESDCIRISEQMIKEGYSKRPQDINALVPLDFNEVEKMFYDVELKDLKGDEVNLWWEVRARYHKKLKQICAKFGKDNSGMVNGSLFPLADIQRKCNIGLSTALKVRDYLYERFSQQPPKEPVHDCGCGMGESCLAIKKERKVSLEEIKKVVRQQMDIYNSDYDNKCKQISQAILSLINATEGQ